MTALKLTRIGNAVGVILPEDILARLKLAEGDTVFVTEAANGGVLLTAQDPSVEVKEQVALGREFMQRYHETFKALASR